MELISTTHNERTKILIKTTKSDYSVVLGHSMQGQMTGLFWVYTKPYPDHPDWICICKGDIDPQLFYPTDEKAISLIEEKVLAIIESYEDIS